MDSPLLIWQIKARYHVVANPVEKPITEQVPFIEILNHTPNSEFNTEEVLLSNLEFSNKIITMIIVILFDFIIQLGLLWVIKEKAT